MFSHLEKIKPASKQRKHGPTQETATPGEVEEFQVPHQCEDKGPSTYAPTIASKKQRESG